jgi:murein L,D-transpeptidase YcbB/YkuD
VEAFIAEHKVPDSISRRIRSFYNTRNYQFAWFSSKGLTEQARGFWNLHDYHTSYNHDSVLHDKALQKRMDRLAAEEELTVSASDKAFINTEITLTEHFIQYSLNAYEGGYLKRKEMERFVPRKQEDAMQLADSILNKKHKDNKYFEDVNASYKALKQELSRYYTIAKNGGWPTIDTVIKKGLKQGLVSPHIAVIKQRLQLSGDMPAGDTSQVFNDTLVQGVKSFQQRHGYTPDGIISANLIKDMNVPALQRVQQILINMDRMRWMPSRPSGDLILVNIPEFVLHVMDGAKKVFDMNVVVGKEGHNTVIFTGDLNQIVFSPYWNVPESIVEKEILPALAKNPNYLADNNMEQTGTVNGFPVVRQLPGPENSLGRVKFLFPNSFDIYFHDTNAKDLFNKDKRAYSHGCIRLADPEKMARYLLRDDASWTPERIQEAMNSGNEKYVKLKDPVPVFISYHTAWVDEEGRLNFREDIYNHDKDLSNKMFTAAL